MAKRLIPHYCYAGVYMIKCVKTGKMYIGSSINIEKRLAEHQSLLIRGKHPCKELQDAFDNCGKVVTEVLYVEPGYSGRAEVFARIRAMEQKYIDEYNAIENGYNQAPVGKKYKGKICRPVVIREYIPDEKTPQE